MAVGIAGRLVGWGQCFIAWVTRRERRIERWVADALPEKRVFWHQSRLSLCAKQLEFCFVGISKAVDGLASKSSCLVENARNILKMSAGQEGDESVFQSSVDLMERPLSFIGDCVQIAVNLDAGLASIGERIRRLRGFKAKFDDSAAPLRILQTMFRIESASSPKEILSLFTSLSAEIESLTTEMSTLVAREFEAIESTVPMMQNVAAGVRRLRDRQTEARGARSVMQESMARIEARFEEDKARDLQLLNASESVAKKIGGMVGALQYQDILNQRLQHVLEGLADVGEEVRELAGGADGGPRRDDALGFLRDASRVEAAQLEGIEEVLNGAVGRLSAALEGLARDAGDLGMECRARDGSRAGGEAADAMVQILLETIRTNTELLEATSRQAEEIGATLQPIGDLLGNLTGRILGVSARIRLIALNAQIQAAQAGGGTGLEVLAFQARAVAEEITAHVVEIIVDLEAVKQELALSLGQVEDMRDRGMEMLRFLMHDGQAQGARLRRFQSRMCAERICAAGGIEGIQAESDRLSRLLEIRSNLFEVIGSARTELQDFSAELAARLRRETTSQRVAEHARSYTAEAERAVHQQALLSEDPCGQCQPAVVPALAEGTVELF